MSLSFNFTWKYLTQRQVADVLDWNFLMCFNAELVNFKELFFKLSTFLSLKNYLCSYHSCFRFSIFIYISIRNQIVIPSFHNRHQPQNFNQLLMVCQKRYSGLRFNLVMNSCWRYIYKITPLFLSYDWHFFDCFIMQSASQTGSLYISVPFRSAPFRCVAIYAALS